MKVYIVFLREGCKDPSSVSSLSDDIQYLFRRGCGNGNIILIKVIT